MSRFVRASKYRHVFGQPAKKEYTIDNVKVTNSAWDTNVIAASGKYISVNWNASGGGAFAILPLPSPFHAIDLPHKLPDSLPLARSHAAPVLDTNWCPHDDSIVASAGDDGKLMIWSVDDAAFEGWGVEGWEPKDFDPILRIDASARKVGQVLWHPTAKNVIAGACGDYTIKLWDVAAPEDPKIVLKGHNDAIQSLAFNSTGTLLATTSRDRKVRLFDPRAGSDAIRIADGHGGIKGARVEWMGDTGRLATTGFSKMSDRQTGIWETGGLTNLKMVSIDQSAGIIMPFYTDNNMLFLAGKGDGNIRYYEYENDSLHSLAEYKSTDPHRGMCFLPRRALNVAECEIARAYKLTGGTVEPLAFIVPRKSDSFQSDIYPPAPSLEHSVTANEFFDGKDIKRRIVDLSSGASSAVTSQTPTSAPTPAPAPKETPAPAPAPTPAPAPSEPATPIASAPISRAASVQSPVESRAYSLPSKQASVDDSLAEENTRLTEELREARALIRTLELQVEAVKANARKAAQSLLDV
jgi:coronin-1B/1C/6